MLHTATLPPIYEVLEDDYEKSESVYFLPKRQQPRYARRRYHARDDSSQGVLSIILIALGTFLLGVISALVIIQFKSRNPTNGSYETGFEEEKLLPASSIELEQVQFKLPVDFASNGGEFLVAEPGDKSYIGTTAEVDAAWKNLLWGRYFSVSEAEAKDLWGDEYTEYWDHHRSGYTAGLDMFHQLHCLNQIRQALHRDVYPETPLHGPVHTDRCLDQLRQSIMCWGSTAVVPLKYLEGYGSEYVKTDAVHTCRKFEPIREFVSERFNGSLFVPRPSGWIDTSDNAF
ncbi:uncharacterized protein F4812DRAFT_31500 [Daldinia caldariorum]|uniref:uncharacterized protein n=1 Tax=Daldinia caldariorum TaxID=326644 RepID=UPI00200795FA|nr:uncharacterized protein F4812DRAFT_31500 [Daldinia caldariorum]KAI1472903.1 hypothetical protein F4812DRAFT_31500 [Daldinia caldariorum]